MNIHLRKFSIFIKNCILLPIFNYYLYLCIVIELQRHIEILLLDNDCVIVPDFGGFVAQVLIKKVTELSQVNIHSSSD